MNLNFDLIRPMFGGSMKQSQVDGINVITEAFGRYGDGDRRKLAYLLATAKHETAHTMQPIHERGKVAYFDKYEPGTAIGKRLGNTLKGDGYKFRGRGYVQLTGRANYSKAGKKIGVDLLANPDAALEPAAAARILILGCLEGWFTGKKLGDYINSATTFVAARRVVNGLDKAETIALMAADFLEAIEDGPAAPVEPPQPAPVDPIDPKDTDPPFTPPKRKTLMDVLRDLFIKQAVKSAVDHLPIPQTARTSPMLTTYNKAIVALVMALIGAANVFLGWNFGIGEEAVAGVVAVLTPLLVWLIPNTKS